MRIAILSWESPWSIRVGDISRHVQALTRVLVALGHEVHLFTRRGSNQTEVEIVDGVHCHRVTYPRQPDFVDDVNEMCRALRTATLRWEASSGRDFDVVHAHEWLTANAMIWIKQSSARRCVLTVHSTELARTGGVLDSVESQRIRAQERAGTYWADRVIAMTPRTAAELTETYAVPPWKSRVITDPGGAEGADAGVTQLLSWHAAAVETLALYDPAPPLPMPHDAAPPRRGGRLEEPPPRAEPVVMTQPERIPVRPGPVRNGD